MFKSIQLTNHTITTLLFLCILYVQPVHAQMFSYGNVDRSMQIQSNQVVVGTEWVNFDYQGNATPAPGERFDAEGMALLLALETDAIDMYIRGLGGITGVPDASFFNLGARLHSRLRLFHNDWFSVLFPFHLQTDLLRSRQENSSNQFQQTAILAGAGLSANLGTRTSIQANASLIPSYGFSNSAGAFFGGSARSLEGRFRLSIPGILPNNRIVAGYDYRFREYDIDIDIYDYRLRSHSVVLGFTF